MGLKLPSSQQINIDSIKDGCASLVAFSNHLMLILVAVIALASNSTFQGHNYYSKILLSCGILVSGFQFYWGYSANIVKINGFLRTDASFKLLPPEERFISGTLSTIKKYVQWQYTATVLAIICIVSSILMDIYFDSSHEPNTALCVQKDAYSTETGQPVHGKVGRQLAVTPVPMRNHNILEQSRSPASKTPICPDGTLGWPACKAPE